MTRLTVLVALVTVPTARGVEPADLKPGLVATFADAPEHPGVTRLEPTVAFAVGKDESPHPRLASGRLVTWKGYVNVVRPGRYTFTANVLGGAASVTVAGKRVLTATADARFTTERETVTLPGGVLPFEATFARAGGAARLELLWEGPDFRREPLHHRQLGHLPADRPVSFVKDAQLEHGRFRFEELACVRCHTPAAGDRTAAGLADRPAPVLTDVAKRSYAGWLDAWLADPSRHRPDTAMPKMFADDAAGRTERAAVVAYLVSLAGKPLPASRLPTVSNEYRQSMERGKTLFAVTGCAACHAEPTPKKVDEDEDEKPPAKPEDLVYGPTIKYRLGALGSKYRPDTLARYLLDPLAVHPAGRMPNLGLRDRDAQDLARYLCRQTDDAVTPDAAAGNVDLGRKLVVSKGCVNCHAVEAGGKPLAPTTFVPLAAVKARSGGCLAPKPDPAKVPTYTLSADDRAALTAFLKDGQTGAGTASPTYAARADLRRFGCLNCHQRNAEGGLSPELTEQMRLLSRAENADDVRPPVLTGVGHKSRTSWLKAVLVDGARARPWTQLRMPQYGPKNVGHLPEALAALEGIAPDDTVHKVGLSNDKLAAGRQLIGKGGLGCISCHDIAGVPNSGTRGPDLATVNQRVRFEWYDRWMHQPLRMSPGTRMPQVFLDGKSPLTAVLKGDADAQAEAMWAYLSLGPGLPLPDGLEPPKGLIVGVGDRPTLLRTFLPDAGSRAVAVGYPGGRSLAFSADQCRLAYGWAGNFLDASPVWDNRGGGYAKLLGPRFWTAPPGHPWGLTANPELPPDFAARADSPAFGSPLPYDGPPRVDTGKKAVQFDGYGLDPAGRPTFQYRLTENDRGAVLTVAETPEPVAAGVASGVRRTFAVSVPGGYRAWLLAGAGVREPRAVGADGKVTPIGKPAEASLPAAGVRLILPGENDTATVVELTAAPAGTAWRFAPRPGGGWFAVVRLPSAEKPSKAAFTLTVWGLPKDDDELLKGLAGR